MPTAPRLAASARLVDEDQAIAAFPKVWDRVRARTPGMVGRSPAWWRVRRVGDPAWSRGSRAPLQRVLAAGRDHVLTSATPGESEVFDQNSIAKDDLWDLSIRYKFLPDNKDTEAFLTIQNVFNTAPPFIGGTVGSTYYAGQANERYDRLGRQFMAGVRFKM